MNSKIKSKTRMSMMDCRKQDAHRLIDIIKKIGIAYCPDIAELDLDVAFCEIFFGDPNGKILKHGLNSVSPENKVYGNVPKYRRIRNVAIDQVQKELKNRIETLEKYKIKAYPKKWMEADSLIKANMEKKGNRYFYKLYQHLTESRMKYRESKEYIKLHKQDLKSKNHVLCVVDREHASKKIGISKDMIHRYLKSMEIFQIISSIGRYTARGNNVYILGRWSNVRNKNPRPLYNLKINPKMRGALRRFSIIR